MKITSTNLMLYPRSLAERRNLEFGLASTAAGKKLVVLAPSEGDGLGQFEGECSELGGDTILLGSLTTRNAATLRDHLPFLQPRLIGLKTSAGMGDRLGLATPGHVRAARFAGERIDPIFAQQSIREMVRTARSPQQVMDDATWGMFEEGWQAGTGADADHLKTAADIDACLAAGFTFFTIDPGEHVNNRAESASISELRELAEMLPVEVRPQVSGLAGRQMDFEDLSVKFDESVLLKASVKYGAALLHVSQMYQYLIKQSGNRPVELEVSVDETELPTSHAEHVYIASELHRMGVKWVSLAPRYVGRFEKGVDYIGDLAEFEADIRGHAAIARQLGPYKLSLHSGSDKFSIYPAMMKHTHGLVHLKTAGTSYLEALRTIAVVEPALLEEIYAFAYARFETDRQTYHVSADLNRAVKPGKIADLPALLDDFDSREILHVTFGSVLIERKEDGVPVFRDRLYNLLRAHSEAYTVNLERHFIRHLAPFIQ